MLLNGLVCKRGRGWGIAPSPQLLLTAPRAATRISSRSHQREIYTWKNFIPKHGFNPTTDLMVLSPMTRGVVGTRNLNKVLQELLNPPSPEKPQVVRGDLIFRVGDRIIQLKNDYQREVFNGDLGTIEIIDREEQIVLVDMNGRQIEYDFADLNEINLAFSTTIHKSQGSEYPVVILPLYMSHYMMLSRNLFYTGLTRAKKLGIIIGSNKAIAIAIKNYRYSGTLYSLSIEINRKRYFLRDHKGRGLLTD